MSNWIISEVGHVLFYSHQGQAKLLNLYLQFLCLTSKLSKKVVKCYSNLDVPSEYFQKQTDWKKSIEEIHFCPAFTAFAPTYFNYCMPKVETRYKEEKKGSKK